jgi:hypothetical protein
VDACRRCAATTARSALAARGNTTKNPSPAVLISRPSCSATAWRTILRCRRRTFEKSSPSCSSSRVDPSISLKSSVRVPVGSGSALRRSSCGCLLELTPATAPTLCCSQAGDRFVKASITTSAVALCQRWLGRDGARSALELVDHRACDVLRIGKGASSVLAQIGREWRCGVRREQRGGREGLAPTLRTERCLAIDAAADPRAVNGGFRKPAQSIVGLSGVDLPTDVAPPLRAMGCAHGWVGPCELAREQRGGARRYSQPWGAGVCAAHAGGPAQVFAWPVRAVCP